MKNKCTLALFLALALLLGALCACGKDSGTETTTEPAEQTTEAAPVEIDLSGYTFVRADDMIGDALSCALNFRKAVNSALSVDMPIKSDWEKDGVSQALIEAKEFLYGRTNRPQTAEAFAKAEDASSFVIAVTENKVIVTAASDEKMNEAGEFFLQLIQDGKLVLPADYLYVSEPVGNIFLVKNGKSTCSVVYKDELDAVAVSTNEKDGIDIEPSYAKEIKKQISKLTSVELKLTTDWVIPGKDISAEPEILVGVTDREECRRFLSSIGYDEYGYAVIGNKVVVAGHNLTTTTAACDLFLEALRSAVITEADGTKSLLFLSDLRKVKKTEGWFTDIPQYDAQALPMCMDCGDSTLQFLYEDATLDNYKNYLKLLESEGYKLAQSNEIKDNLFAAYTSEKGLIYVYYVPYDKQVRIITTPDGKYALPDYPTMEAVPAYTKIADPSITQMELNYGMENFGACYIITLADGSFVVIDGGGYNANYGDDTRLYQTLKSLNKSTDGKIHIAAWILTHEHWDHYTNFYNMVIAHSKDILIERYIMNTPAKSFVTNSNNPNYYNATGLPAMQKATGNGAFIKVHTGMTFCLCDAKFEVLFTQEDILPGRCNYFNETSLVVRMEMEGNTVLWTGDSKNYASKAMVNRFGDYLHVDIASVGHHGYDSLTQKCYSYIAPKTFLWPTSKANVTTLVTGKKYVDDYIWNLVGEQNIIIAEPTATILLPFRPGDPVIR